MTCVRYSGGAGVGDPSLGLDGLSSTCSSSTCSLKDDLGEVSKIFGGWTEKSIGGSRATIDGICGSSGKKFKAEEVDREARK